VVIGMGTGRDRQGTNKQNTKYIEFQTGIGVMRKT
jgi:hypothetical protein